jgi:hypothetical protein
MGHFDPVERMNAGPIGARHAPARGRLDDDVEEGSVRERECGDERDDSTRQ